MLTDYRTDPAIMALVRSAQSTNTQRTYANMLKILEAPKHEVSVGGFMKYLAETTDRRSESAINLLRAAVVDHLVMFGIAPTTEIHDQANRPYTLATGEPLMKLFNG